MVKKLIQATCSFPLLFNNTTTGIDVRIDPMISCIMEVLTLEVFIVC